MPSSDSVWRRGPPAPTGEPQTPPRPPPWRRNNTLAAPRGRDPKASPFAWYTTFVLLSLQHRSLTLLQGSFSRRSQRHHPGRLGLFIRGVQLHRQPGLHLLGHLPVFVTVVVSRANGHTSSCVSALIPEQHLPILTNILAAPASSRASFTRRASKAQDWPPRCCSNSSPTSTTRWNATHAWSGTSTSVRTG